MIRLKCYSLRWVYSHYIAKINNSTSMWCLCTQMVWFALVECLIYLLARKCVLQKYRNQMFSHLILFNTKKRANLWLQRHQKKLTEITLLWEAFNISLFPCTTNSHRLCCSFLTPSSIRLLSCKLNSINTINAIYCRSYKSALTLGNCLSRHNCVCIAFTCSILIL